jgi:hypothetical protein
VSENLGGADNQQESLSSEERRSWFLAGFVEARGACMSLSRGIPWSASATTSSRNSSSTSTVSGASFSKWLRSTSGPAGFVRSRASGCPRLLHHLQIRDHGACASVSTDVHAVLRQEIRLRDVRSRSGFHELRTPSRSPRACRHRAARFFHEHEGEAGTDRAGGDRRQNPQRPYARHSEAGVKRWSDLHGDMES